MPFRQMTEKETKENAELIAKIKKEIERMKGILAGYEAQKVEGVYYSEKWSEHKGK